LFVSDLVDTCGVCQVGRLIIFGRLVLTWLKNFGQVTGPTIKKYIHVDPLYMCVTVVLDELSE